MTTHTIEESKYFGAWVDALKGYAERDPAYLDACKKQVGVSGVGVGDIGGSGGGSCLLYTSPSPRD